MLVALAAPGSASAAIPSVLNGQTLSGNPIPCTTQSDGTRVCHGADGGGGSSDLRLKSFDGTPLEVYVILPPAPASGTDGSYPLIVQSHGWGQQAGGPNSAQYLGPTADTLAKAGYAVLQLTARGFGDSCGSAASRLVNALACANGYIRLDDDRYEVRDVQYATGLLVDAGIGDPARIGITGESYGGGVSLQLATLKDRVMNADGSLGPWTSPTGMPLRIAAAAPVIPWSDLAYSLLPNGRTLDYGVTGPTNDLHPIGVAKQSFVAGLFALGAISGYYAPPAVNPQADLTTWFGLINAGEPYDSNPLAQSIVGQIARYHSAYYLLGGAYGNGREAPSPLLIANGFTDDLFPVDEALRYYNLEHAMYRSDPISLFDWDGGHQRGQNKPGDLALLAGRIQGFFDHYLKASGSQQPPGVTALAETCPATAPSGGPFTAATWAALHPGEVDFSSSAIKTVLSSAGDPSIAKTIDPILGGGACATAPAADQGAGVASYRLPAATGSGYTLLGAATVIANLTVTGRFALVAARLWDVDPITNTETLLARGIYRIDSSAPDGLQVFQLHPGAWHFAAGHFPKLELLGQDSPYARSSNGVFSISVSDLQLRLPVHEVPGASGTPSAVKPPRPRVTPHPHAA
jgi:dienelactone hydrolase